MNGGEHAEASNIVMRNFYMVDQIVTRRSSVNMRATTPKYPRVSQLTHQTQGVI
mgnify:CR=1 FL=1